MNKAHVDDALQLSSEFFGTAGASREIVEDWVDKFVQLHVFQFPATETEILGYSARALDQELERNVFNDIGLLALAYGLMIGFLSFSLGKPLSKLNGRVLISAANTVCLLVATGAAYGLLMWLGVTFTSLSQLGKYLYEPLLWYMKGILTLRFDSGRSFYLARDWN